jgi:hypothetical protein
MELTKSISNTQQLRQILENKQNQTLAVAQKTVKDIVNTEMSLFNFEIMMGLSIDKPDSKRLTKLSRNLRDETHKELMKLSNNNFEKMNEILNNF